MHLVDSLGKCGMDYVCFQHEQGAACAAEAYGQHTNTPGFLMVTSGPGAANAITPVAAGWIDSTPMFVVSGQAKRSDLVGGSNVRQIGSQEVPIIPMVAPITKYAVEVMEPTEIYYHLERAWYEATTGRPGPVWLSIPLDVQGAQIDEQNLSGFILPEERRENHQQSIQKCLELLRDSKKPLLLAGNGIKIAGGETALLRLLEQIPIPVQTTWKCIDLIGEDHPLYMGHPGIMGGRGDNLFLQQADLLISVGSRLDTSLTAFNEPNFAKNAKKVIVDIDPNELKRMKMEKEVSLQEDARRFLEGLLELGADKKLPIEAWKDWLDYGKTLRRTYPCVTEEQRAQTDYVSTYYLIDRLCDCLTESDVIVPVCSGGAGDITIQAFRMKAGQKMKNAAGLGSMGFGLPYAVGSCIANEKRRTILINGDGAFQLNIQELETVRRLNLPIKMFILCNDGYASIRAMQNNNFGRCVASGPDSGYTVPDLEKIAAAYGLPTFHMENHQALNKLLAAVLETPGPCLCTVKVSPLETVSPRVRAIPQPDGSMKPGTLEDMWPECR